MIGLTPARIAGGGKGMLPVGRSSKTHLKDCIMTKAKQPVGDPPCVSKPGINRVPDFVGN